MGPSVGSYTLTAKATDNLGAQTTSVGINAIITAPGQNQLPTAAITSPANNDTYTPGTTITIQATATDPDGTIAKVEFYQGTTKLGEDTGAPYSYTWNSAPAGSYTLTAKATDNLGGQKTSAGVNVAITTPLGSGNIYYASPTGTGNGTSLSSPFKIANFWTVAQPGDTLLLLDGTYRGVDSMIHPPVGLSGTSGNPIT
ncbi:MAG: Ig-like domain-containing protein, partial [Candidatus Veblenbacteria bacterium]|nr:Ig-like domain-containing protein [Candidatus Veblenbacteria bacterium]